MISRAIVSVLLLAASLGLAGGVVRGIDARDPGFALDIDPFAGWASLAGMATRPGPPGIAWRGLPAGTRAVVIALDDVDGSPDRPLWLAVVPVAGGGAAPGRTVTLVPFRPAGPRALWRGRFLLSARALSGPVPPHATREQVLALARSGAGALAFWQAGGGWLRRAGSHPAAREGATTPGAG